MSDYPMVGNSKKMHYDKRKDEYTDQDPEGPIQNDGLTTGLAYREGLGHCTDTVVSAKLGKDKYGDKFEDRGGNDAGPVF